MLSVQKILISNIPCDCPSSLSGATLYHRSRDELISLLRFSAVVTENIFELNNKRLSTSHWIYGGCGRNIALVFLCQRTSSLPCMQVFLVYVEFQLSFLLQISQSSNQTAASFSSGFLQLLSSVMGRTTLSSWCIKVNGYRVPSCLCLLVSTRIFLHS